MKVLDSCMIIHSDYDFTKGGYVTTNSVLSELISDIVRLVVDQALREGFIILRDPKKESIGKIKKAAKESGDLSVLSATDIDVLALALEINGELWTDDYAAQNVAKKLGIKYKATAKDGIKKEISWGKVCPSCYKKYPLEKRVCDVCGTELRKKSV